MPRPTRREQRLAKEREPSEFERFEALTKGLVSVSKEELDDERKRDDEKRSKK